MFWSILMTFFEVLMPSPSRPNTIGKVTILMNSRANPFVN